MHPPPLNWFSSPNYSFNDVMNNIISRTKNTEIYTYTPFKFIGRFGISIYIYIYIYI